MMANWDNDDGDFGNEEEPVPQESKWCCWLVSLFCLAIGTIIYLLILFSIWQ